jgi:hypothetical protein
LSRSAGYRIVSSVYVIFFPLNHFRRQPLIAKAQVRSQASLCGISGGQIDNVTGFSPNTSVFFCQCLSPAAITDAILTQQLRASLKKHLKKIQNKHFSFYILFVAFVIYYCFCDFQPVKYIILMFKGKNLSLPTP